MVEIYRSSLNRMVELHCMCGISDESTETTKNIQILMTSCAALAVYKENIIFLI